MARTPYDKSTGQWSRLVQAFGFSMQGLGAAWRHEAAFRLEVALAVVGMPLAVWLGRNPIERLLLLGSIVLMLIIELLNSAIEALADAQSTDHHPLLGRAKDMGSAAVLLATVLAGLTWAWLLLPRWWPS